MSTASSRAPTTVVQPAPGVGTSASRVRSTPYSSAASALIRGKPTSAHQAPSPDAAPSSASSSDTEPLTLTVLPRRNPPGSSPRSAGSTGSGGAVRTPTWRQSTVAATVGLADRHVQHGSIVEQMFETVN